MDWFVKAFIRASVIWLAIGVSLGVAMAIHPVWTVLKPAHLHINVVGFVAMMIFGVAYHVLPRFAGIPLRSRTAAGVHWLLANIGLALMVVGFTMRGVGTAHATLVLAVGGTLEAAGAYVFAWLIFQTLSARPAVRAVPAPGTTSPSPSISRRATLPTMN